MKRNLLLPLFLTAFLAAFSQVPEKAQDKKKEVREIKAIGCVRRGVEGGCLLLRTLDGSITYNILANPRPDVGIVIEIDGTPFRGVTACMEGTPVTVTKWEATGEKCQN